MHENHSHTRSRDVTRATPHHAYQVRNGCMKRDIANGAMQTKKGNSNTIGHRVGAMHHQNNDNHAIGCITATVTNNRTQE